MECEAVPRKNLGLESVILKTITKVGVAHRPPCPQKRNISPRCCLNPLRFLVFDSKTADKPENSLCSIVENCGVSTGWNTKLSTDKAVGENAPAPYLTTTITTTT